MLNSNPKKSGYVCVPYQHDKFSIDVKMKFEGLTPHSSVGVQTKLMTCLIYQNKSVSKHAWNNYL